MTVSVNKREYDRLAAALEHWHKKGYEDVTKSMLVRYAIMQTDFKKMPPPI